MFPFLYVLLRLILSLDCNKIYKSKYLVKTIFLFCSSTRFLFYIFFECLNILKHNCNFSTCTFQYDYIYAVMVDILHILVIFFSKNNIVASNVFYIRYPITQAYLLCVSSCNSFSNDCFLILCS